MKECKIMGKQENLEKTEKKSAMESAGAKDPHRYDDMLFLPHHVSSSHPPMSMENRAAQFSPFAALTGYGDVVKEAGRWTEQKIELDETEKELSKQAFDRHIRIIDPEKRDYRTLPVCRDKDDQKFMELAYDAHASCLITKDKALLKLAIKNRKNGYFTIITPDQWIAGKHRTTISA